MSYVNVKLMPESMMFESFKFNGKMAAFAAMHEDKYNSVMQFDSDEPVEDICEYVFDLTNNPYRQDEREEKYGRGRSLSVGDIVEVDGIAYVCDSSGWAKIN